MKRILILVLALVLILSGAGCTPTQTNTPTEETVIGATEATPGNTQPQPETEPQETLTQDPTEQTDAPAEQPTQPDQATQPTQVTQLTQPTDPATAAPTQPTQNTQKPVIPTETAPTVTPTDTTPRTEPTAIQTAPATQPKETQSPTQITETPVDPGCQHDYQQTYTKAATCTAEGYKKFTCKKCGAVVRQQIPVKEHSYKAATCLQPKTCTVCSHTEGTALGHSYGTDHLCSRCGVKDPAAPPDVMPVNFVATVRSDEGVVLPGITVTVRTASQSGNAVTDKNGVATIPLSLGSSRYTVELYNVPEGYQAQESYSYTSAQVTINLKSLPVRTDPNDHSKARYEEGDKMMDFTVTDVDGRTYQLSQLLKENKLIILDFWYVSCNPCKKEFPYFETALEAYGDDVVLLAVDPFYSAEDIRQLRDEMELSFPVFQDPLGLSGGFRVESYPTTVFIDSTGTIRKIHRGAFSDEAAFLKAVAAYL